VCAPLAEEAMEEGLDGSREVAGTAALRACCWGSGKTLSRLPAACCDCTIHLSPFFTLVKATACSYLHSSSSHTKTRASKRKRTTDATCPSGAGSGE
jgi:hypothetical protein